MNSVETETGISSFTEIALSLELNEELPCEMGDHGSNPRWHEGPGAWYIHYECSVCDEKDIILVCDKSYRMMRKLWDEDCIICDGCNFDVTPSETFIREVKRV